MILVLILVVAAYDLSEGLVRRSTDALMLLKLGLTAMELVAAEAVVNV